MRSIQSKNTKPEIAIRKGLFARGIRYRIHAKELPGKPDIVLPKFRSVIFVNGCFWHGHNCSLFSIPATRRKFWIAKFAQNQRRDIAVLNALHAAGWRSLTVWECSIRGPSRLELSQVLDMVEAWLHGTNESLEIRGKPVLD